MSNSKWIKTDLYKLFCGCLSLDEINSLIENRLSKFNGKLYRYYSFTENDSNYSLANLKDGIIYFQEPIKFNDPFDCALGFSVDAILQAIVPTLINENLNVNGENKELIKSAVTTVFCGDKELPETDDLTTSTIIKIISVPRIADMINRMQNGNIPADILQQLLNPNLNIQNIAQSNNYQLALELFLQKPNIFDFLNKLNLNIEQVKLFNTLKNILQKESVTEKIELLCDTYGNNGEELNNELKKINKQLDEIIPNIKKSINDNFAIACFSESPDNVLMWSHYANKHTGFCVEYDFTKIKDRNKLLLLCPAIYTDTRPSVPLSLFDMSNPYDIKTSIDKESIVDIYYALLCKSSYWSYENEWRIICSKGELTESKLFEDLAVKVYLGANIGDADKNSLLEVIKSKPVNIEIVQYKLGNAKFKLVELAEI